MSDHLEEKDIEDLIKILPSGEVIIVLEDALAPHSGKGEDIAFGISEIKLRPIYAGDIIYLDKGTGELEKLMSLATRLSDLPKKVIERLSARDYGKLVGIVSQQMGKFQQTMISVQDFWQRSSDGLLERSKS